MDGHFLEEKSALKVFRFSFASKLDWGSYIISITKTTSKMIGALICSMKFLFHEVVLKIYHTDLMEYGCHIWAGALSYYSEKLDKLQKQICRIVGPSLTESLEPLARRQSVASLSLFYRYYFCRYSSKLSRLVPLLSFFLGGLLVFLINQMIFLSQFLDAIRMTMTTVSFLEPLDYGILRL